MLLVLCEEITNKNDIASKHLLPAQKVAVSIIMIGLLTIAQQHPNEKLKAAKSLSAADPQKTYLKYRAKHITSEKQ